MIVNLIIVGIILITGLMFYEDAGIYADSRYYRKRYILLICLILILQSGLRNVAVGADTYAYYESFELVKVTSWKEIGTTISDYYRHNIGKDPGYLAFQKISQVLITNYQIYLCLIAVLFFSALGNFIYKNTKRLADAIFAFILYLSLFYAFFSITGIRQTIATAATIWSFEFIKQRKLLPFLILILLASTIHKSALIFLPFYYIAPIKNTKYLYGIVSLLFILFMFFKIPVSAFFKRTGGYEDYITPYQGAGTYTFTFMLLLIGVIAFMQMNFIIYKNKTVLPFYNAFALAIVFAPLTWVNPSAMRVVQYYSIFMLLLIPNIIQSFRCYSLKIKRLAFSIAIAMLILLYIKSGMNSEYKFFWQTMELGENYN